MNCALGRIAIERFSGPRLRHATLGVLGQSILRKSCIGLTARPKNRQRPRSDDHHGEFHAGYRFDCRWFWLWGVSDMTS